MEDNITEERVRQIVRQELDRYVEELMSMFEDLTAGADEEPVSIVDWIFNGFRI